MQETETRRAQVTLPSDTEILIVREFDATPDALYRCFTEPELVERWFHARRGRMTEVTIDFRVGGAWRYEMEVGCGSPQEGAIVAWHGVHREIVPSERISRTAVFEPYPEAEAVETVTFIPTALGTRAEIHVKHLTKEARDGHIESGMESGLNDALDLAEELAKELSAGE